MCEAVPKKIAAPIKQLSDQAVKQKRQVMPWWFLGNWCLPESTGGEACLCQNSREGGFQTSVVLASTVLLGHL